MDRPRHYNGGLDSLPNNAGKYERAVIEKNKTKLFETMANKLIQYHGSIYKFKLAANISNDIMDSIAEYKISVKNARRILDAYNKMKKDQRNGK
jgi:hypothetical protein